MVHHSPSLRERLKTNRRDIDKATGWKRVRTDPYSLDSMKNDKAWLSERRQVFVGDESVTDMENKTRYIHQLVWPCTSGELARLYLRQHFGYRPHLYRRQFKSHMSRRLPILCEPRVGNLAYIDLRHAYWEIIRYYPFHTCYLPEENEIVIPWDSWSFADEIDADRRLRHALVGTLFTKEMSSYRYGVWTTDKVRGRYLQPSLYRITMDTISAIALDISRHFELWGWLTDAMIVTERQSADVVAFLMERWSFPAKIEARGHGVIYSNTSYRIGDLMTDLSKWSEDQVNSKGGREPRSVKYMPRVNVTWWRGQRKRVLGLEQ